MHRNGHMEGRSSLTKDTFGFIKRNDRFLSIVSPFYTNCACFISYLRLLPFCLDESLGESSICSGPPWKSERDRYTLIRLTSTLKAHLISNYEKIQNLV